MATTISGVLITGLKQYDEVLEQVHSHYFAEVPRQLWEDERGRLRLWAGNIGAHQRGPSSLDHRLRDASHVKSQVIKLLERYDKVLRELRSDPSRQPSQQTQTEQEYMDDEFSSDEDHETEAQSIYKSLVSLMNALFKVSLIIRNPAQHDRILNSRREDSDGESILQTSTSANDPDLAGQSYISRLDRIMSGSSAREEAENLVSLKATPVASQAGTSREQTLPSYQPQSQQVFSRDTPGQTELLQDNMQRRTTIQVRPTFSKEDNESINLLAAEMAKHASYEVVSKVWGALTEQQKQQMAQKHIDPLIAHFRDRAIRQYSREKPAAQRRAAMDEDSMGTSAEEDGWWGKFKKEEERKRILDEEQRILERKEREAKRKEIEVKQLGQLAGQADQLTPLLSHLRPIKQTSHSPDDQLGAARSIERRKDGRAKPTTPSNERHSPSHLG